MRIIEFFKRLFHREKPIEIKPKKYLNPPKKMKQKKDLNPPKKMKQTYVAKSTNYLDEIIYIFLTIFLYLLKCPQSLILSALRAFCFCGKPHISRSIFLYFRYQAWLKSW